MIKPPYTVCNSEGGLAKYIQILEKREKRHVKTIISKNSQIRRLKKNLLDQTSLFLKVESEAGDVKSQLLKYFSPTQYRIMQGNYNKNVVWPEDDLVKAISLFTVSSRAYMYLRDSMKFPLPCKSTIYYWLAKIEVLPGKLITPAIQVLKSELAEAPSLSKVAVLAFDEISIDSKYCYDMKNDVVRGKHEDACVTAVRGLFYKWKQIIHYQFGKNIGKDDLLNMIRILFDAGIDVRSIVSDMGTKISLADIRWRPV